MKVYLQYPWKFPDSPYYKYLIENPPEEVEYVNIQKQKGVITSKNKFKLMNKLKSLARKVLYLLKRPNIVKTKGNDYDLIHCCHCLSKNKSDWMVDVEHYWNFASSGKLAYSEVGKKRINNLLMKDNCKKILAWSNAAKNTITRALGKRIANKIEVVYPAIPAQNIFDNYFSNDKLTLLFVGRYFYGKGGHHALKVFDRLTKLFPTINCIVVSEVPDKIKQMYANNKQIFIYDLMKQDKLFKLFKEADIFFYPGYSDTFGFALLEAMSFGLPIVTAEGFARNEIVNSKTGVIIPTGKVQWVKGKPIFKDEDEIIDDFVSKTSSLIKLSFVRNKMGENAYHEIESGKFSIAERNKKLIRIYGDCLK